MTAVRRTVAARLYFVVRWRIVGLCTAAIAVGCGAFAAGEGAQSLVERMDGLRRDGKYAEAFDAGLQALALTERLHGSDHPDAAQCHMHLACLLSEMGDLRKASTHADRSRRAVKGYVSTVLCKLDALEQMRFLKSHDERQLHAMLSIGFAGKEDADVAALSAGWLANGKAVAQEAAVEVMLLARAGGSPVALEMVERLKLIRGQLASIRQTTPATGQADGYRRRVVTLEAGERDLLHALGAEVAGLRQGHPWVPIETIREQIPASAVVVDIARFEPYDFGGQPGGDGTPGERRPARYVAWIIPPAGRGRIMVVDLGEAGPIDEMVGLLRAAIQTDAGPDGAVLRDGESVAEKSLVIGAVPLAKRTIQPILAAATQAIGATPEELVLSPDGGLWLLPWAALPLADGRYCVEDVAISYVSSSRELTRPSAPEQSVAREDALILAAPDYDQPLPGRHKQPKHSVRSDTQDGSTIQVRRRFARAEPLPGTLREAYRIAPAIGRLTGTEPSLVTGSEASESRLKAARGPSVVVLSTHGFFLADQSETPSLMALLLGGGGRTAPAESKGDPLENPLTRCGLVLAGCNAVAVEDVFDATADLDDGILTGLEIVGCDLRGTGMVVLSACQTGLGDVCNGEGVAGLRQAFRLAGAKTVVATLWSIPDGDTADLITTLFTSLADGMDAARALRAAQVRAITERRKKYDAAHPHSWAAFTVTGR